MHEKYEVSIWAGEQIKGKYQNGCYLKTISQNHWQIQGAPPAHAPPQQDQFLSFSHTFLPKSVCVGGWCPPNGSAPPQWEILDPPLRMTKKQSTYVRATCAYSY